MRVAPRPWVDAPEPRVELEVRAAGEAAVDDGLLEDDAAHAAGVRAGRLTTSWPASSAVPLVGTIVVVSIPIVVDLPAPLGPSRPNTSPAATSKSIPLTASTPPGKVFVRLRTWTAAAARPLVVRCHASRSSSWLHAL